jgi:predicted DNA-binding protein (MmcQ/YjbR family)
MFSFLKIIYNKYEVVIMNFEWLKSYCLSKKGAVQDFPFNDVTLVFKVGGKMFALTNISTKPLSVNLKCEPFLALALREEHPQITPGYHMNKKYWNTIILDGAISEEKIRFMIDLSYELVYNKLTRAERERIEYAFD